MAKHKTDKPKLKKPGPRDPNRDQTTTKLVEVKTPKKKKKK